MRRPPKLIYFCVTPKKKKRWPYKGNAKLFKNTNSIRSNFYNKILKQEKTEINNNKEYKWLNQLLIYLNKDYYFLNPSNSHNNIQIIGLHRIMEKFF